MIVGHLPSGYVLAKLLAEKVAHIGATPRQILLACLLGAIAPDFDMLYFHLVDNGKHHHHTYWSHLPIVWLSSLLLCMLCYKLTSRKKETMLSMLLVLAGIVHLILDSIVGDIWWLMPLVDKPYSLFGVPARFDPWWLNFILHWSFAMEMVLWLWAYKLWSKGMKRP
jgi:inner membrane protein